MKRAKKEKRKEKSREENKNVKKMTDVESRKNMRGNEHLARHQISRYLPETRGTDRRWIPLK